MLFGSISSIASVVDSAIVLDSAQRAQLKAYNDSATVWLNKQVKPGLNMDSSKITYDEEVKRIISDPVYRDSVYRQPYTWLDVRNTLQRNNIRLAFWQLINLYPTNKEKVLKIALAYDQAIKGEKLVNAAFYTYAMLDPRITKIEEGKPNIYRPDIMEELFHFANEISAYVVQVRKAKQDSTTKK